MFTGIIHITGHVNALNRSESGARLVLDAPDVPRPLAHGASICVNGVCLTVVDSDISTIAFDVVPETMNRSTLGSLRHGTKVNLEPSLRAGDAMDGHIVQGHVDGSARLDATSREKDGSVWTFTPDAHLMGYMIPKGSIAIDGVSLTIAEVSESTFSVALIPTTLEKTTLGERHIGDRVNIETDIIARTVVATLQRQQNASTKTPLNVDVLQDNGW